MINKEISEETIKELKMKAQAIRKSVIVMLHKAESGHTAGSLDIVDILTYLYFFALRHNPKEPNWNDRDRLVLSNGHICPALYATMAEVGYFQKADLDSLRKFGSPFQGHPHREFLPYLETSSGPLGSGLSQAVGMAMAIQLNEGYDSSKRIYCILSDGEHNSGQTWESAMLASKYKLDNLTIIIDRNYIQIGGKTEDIMPLDSLALKWQSFNFHVEEIDGHDFREINRAINRAKHIKFRPTVIIAYTIPGKGVKEFDSYKWHGKVPNKEQTERSLKELNNYA